MTENKQIFEETLPCHLDDDIKRFINFPIFTLNPYKILTFNLKNNSITLTRKRCHILVFFLTFLINAMCLYRFFTVEIRDIPNVSRPDIAMIEISLYGFFTIALIGATVTLILNVINRRHSVHFILKIEAINRSIDISEGIKTLILWNRVLCSTIIGVNILTTVLFYSTFDYFFDSELIPDCILDFSFLFFDINTVLSIQVLTLLRKYIEKWIEMVVKMKDTCTSDNCVKCFDLLKIYKKILEAHDLYKTIFQVVVLFSISCDSFLRCLGNVSITLIIINKRSFGIRETVWSIATIIIIIKNMGLLIQQSLCCEKFNVCVQEAETVCFELIKKKNCPESHKRLAKNILRMNENFSTMSACGLFYVDAALPMCLVGVISNYVFTIVQFIFV